MNELEQAYLSIHTAGFVVGLTLLAVMAVAVVTHYIVTGIVVGIATRRRLQSFVADAVRREEEE